MKKRQILKNTHFKKAATRKYSVIVANQYRVAR